MNILAKLRKTARPVVLIVATVAALVSFNALASASHESAFESRSASHCHPVISEAVLIASDIVADVSKDNGGFDSFGSHDGRRNCCEKECRCPFAATACVPVALLSCLFAPINAELHPVPLLVLGGSDPSDLLRPPI